jgi:hypothetical protein
VEKTIYVPTWVTETRTCKETHYRQETQQRTCTTYRCEQVTKQVECPYTVWEEVEKVDEQSFEVATPVYNWVDQKYTEYTTGKGTVTKTRQVRKWVPSDEPGCCKDKGKWVCQDETYECEEEICVPIERTRRVKQWDTKKEMKTVSHKYKTLEPRTKTKLRTVCVTERIPEVTTYEVCVCVPHTVEKQVQVKVCRMVPKTVQVPARCGCE